MITTAQASAASMAVTCKLLLLFIMAQAAMIDASESLRVKTSLGSVLPSLFPSCWAHGSSCSESKTY